MLFKKNMRTVPKISAVFLGAYNSLDSRFHACVAEAHWRASTGMTPFYELINKLFYI